MKRGSTIILRAAIGIIGLTVITACAVILPVLIRGDGGEYGPIVIGLYVTTLPFFVALVQALKLLRYVDKNKAFSAASLKALMVIKYCAITIGAVYAAGMPYIYIVADRDDAPGVIVLGLVVIFASFVIATFTAVAQKLFQNAIEIKSENDLTV